jgi:WD40 repeat protein
MPVTGPSAQGTPKSTLRQLAIVIGINNYQKGVPALRNAVPDAQAVARLLSEAHGYEVRLLLDDQGTLAGLRTCLAALPAELSPDTRLVVYFAGHGHAEPADDEAGGPQGFLLPQDAQGDDPTTFLAMAELQAHLSKLPCNQLLLFLDCCFAGALRWSQTRSLRVKPATLFKERYERYLRDAAWQVIASAASDEKALDLVAGGKLGRRSGQQDHSPFAAALCRGLAGDADLRVSGQAGDGVIVANELHVYLESQFALLENQLGRSVQKPLLWSFAGRDKGQFIFYTPGHPVSLPSALELSEGNNPYRGLEPYEEKNAALFFGRTEVVDLLCKQVLAQPLTVVRAGLIPRLRTDSGWHILPVLRPGNHPLAALQAAYSELGSSEPADLSAAVAGWRTQNVGKKLLLCIDQLEELVTMDAAPADQKRFLEILAKALADHGEQLRVVMTLRSDFEPHFFDLLSPKSGQQVRFLVRPLNRSELRQVIEGPASERVLYFEPPTLVDQVIDEVAEMPGALPLLSFTMSELYRSYVRSGHSDRYLTAADYQKLNGVTGALSQRADEIFAGLDAEHQNTLRRTMLRMVALETGDVARRRVPMEELRYGDGHPEEKRVALVLQQLREARLIVSGRDSEGVTYVEPAHDKLVLGWPQLWNALKQEQESIPLHRLLTQEAVTWAGLQRNGKHLWNANPRLQLALALQRTEPQRFNALETEFIQKSEGRRRRLRNLLGSAVATVVTALSILAAVAWLQRESARQQTRRADGEALTAKQRLLATFQEQGRQQLLEKGNPHEGLLWLHRAYEGGSSSAMLPYLLHTALENVDATKVVLVGGGYDVQATFSPDGRRIAAALGLHPLQILDAENGKPLVQARGVVAYATHVAYSRDGRRIVATQSDFAVRVMDAESGNVLSVLKGAGLRFTRAVFSPDGRRVITVSAEKNAKIWDAASGTLLAELGAEAIVTHASYSPDGRLIGTESLDKIGQVWDARSGKRLLQFKDLNSPRDAEGLLFSPDGRHILTMHANSARIWTAKGGKLVAVLGEDRSLLTAATFDRSGGLVVTARADGTGYVWETAPGKLRSRLQGHSDRVQSAAFSASNDRIVTAGDDKTVRVWDPINGRLLFQLLGHGAPVRRAVFDAEDRRILSLSDDRTARVWEVQRGKRFAARNPFSNDWVNSAAYSPDDRRIVTAHDGSASARVWDIASGKLIVQLQGHQSAVNDAGYSRDGRRIVTASSDQTVRIWDAGSGSCLAVLPGHVGGARSASFSPDGRRVVAISQYMSPRLWDAESGKLLAELKSGAARDDAAGFSPDGRYVYTMPIPHGPVATWDADSGKLLRRIAPAADFPMPTITPSGLRLLTKSTKTSYKVEAAASGTTAPRVQTQNYVEAQILGADGSTVLGSLQGLPVGTVVNRVDYRADGRVVALGLLNFQVWTWQVDNGRLLNQFKGHTARIGRIVFSPDQESRRIVTVSDDSSTRIWETASGRLLAAFIRTDTRREEVHFSTDGRYLLGVEPSGALLWDVGPETRPAKQIAALIRCYVPAQFEREDSDVVVFRMPTPAECQGDPGRHIISGN